MQRPERTAAQEETRIPRRSLRLVCRGRPLRVDDGAASFLVHSFLFSTTEGLPDVTLNWENDEARWVTPDEVADFDAVPSLVRPSATNVYASTADPLPQTEALARVLLPPAAAMAVLRLRDDRAHGSAQLAGWALDALYLWAAAPWGGASDGPRSPRAAADGGPRWARERTAEARLRDVAYALAASRPAMASLRSATARVVADATRNAGVPLGEALQAAIRAERARRDVAAAAADAAARALLHDGLCVVTTSLSSSVLRALCVPDTPDARARLRVLACESRPLREGVTTAARCAEAGHAVQLVTDAAAAVHVAALRGADAIVLVGADAVTPAGGVVNKVGTRALAMAAAEAGVRVFAVATSDKALSAGAQAETEEMEAAEVDSAPPRGVTVRNVYFEETPAELISGGIIHEGGLEDAAAFAARAAPAARTLFAEAFPDN